MRQKMSGFTLIEMLVVIAILSILMSMIIPALERSRQLATGISCMNNLRQIGMAFQMYREISNIYPSRECGIPNISEDRFATVLNKYLDVNIHGGNNNSMMFIGKKSGGVGCPGNDKYFWVYAYNFNINHQPFNKTKDNSIVMICSGNNNYQIFPHNGQDHMLVYTGSWHAGNYNALFHGSHVKSFPWSGIDVTDEVWDKPYWIDHLGDGN